MGYLDSPSAGGGGGTPTVEDIHAFEANASTQNIWVYNNQDNLCRYATVVSDSSEAYDENPGSSSFTAPEDGLYHFEARINVPTNSGNGQMKLKRSGTQVATTVTLVPADLAGTISSDVYLTAGQNVRAYLYWTGGVEGWANQSDQSYFKGHMVGTG